MPTALNWRQALVAVFRQLPGYLLDAPHRWLLWMHSPDSESFCTGLEHRGYVSWPCDVAVEAQARLDSQQVAL